MSRNYGLAVNDTYLEVRESGTGDPALVFLHYWGGSHRTWTDVIAHLGEGRRAIAYDHRGWGESGKTGDDFGLEAMAADAVALIRESGLDRFVLVGMSMGGKVAQMLAGRGLTGLEALILVAPAPPTPMLLSPEEKAGRLGAYQSEAGVEAVMQHLLTRPIAPALRRQVIQDTLAGTSAAKRAWLEDGVSADITADAAAITVPTLVITGTHDLVDPEPVLRREIGSRVAHAEFVVLDGVGHLSPIEAPVEVATAISDFLGRIGC